VGDSLKNSINPEMNQSEAGPEIADDAHLHSGDGKLQPAAFLLLDSKTFSHGPQMKANDVEEFLLPYRFTAINQQIK
jgi:hypothetical protein